MPPPVEGGDDGTAVKHTMINSLDFNGGSVAEYVRSLFIAAGLGGHPANVVISEGADRVDIPPVRLRGVTLGAALTMINQLGVPARVSDAGAAIMVIEGRPVGNRTQVWDLADLIEAAWSAEEILSAIETTLDMQGTAIDSEFIRFHEPTGLLIARLQPDGIMAIEQIIVTLQRSVDQRDAQTEVAVAHLREMEGKLQAQRSEAEARLGQMEREFAQREMMLSQEGRVQQEVSAQQLRQMQEQLQAHHLRAEEAQRSAMNQRQELMEQEIRFRAEVEKLEGLVAQLESELAAARRSQGAAGGGGGGDGPGR